MDEYSYIVMIVHISLYSLAYLVTSIYCAVISTGSKTADDKWYTPIKRWWTLVSQKNSIYLAAIPYIFDQATDFGLITKWYFLWQQEERGQNVEGASMKELFFASIGIIIFHRFVSCLSIYRLTKNCCFVLLQSLELLILRAIWVSYKIGSDAPSNPQRYLGLLEASLESGPQLILSTGYLFKTHDVSLLVLISILTSLLSITKRVSADDKQVFPWDCNQPFQSKPFRINCSYFSRVFLWRFFEITSRAFVCILVWINLGGFALCIILGGEFLYLCYLGNRYKSYDVFTNFMYVVLISDYRDCQYFIFLLYRAIGPILLMVTMTSFAVFPFECWKCGQNRYAETFENKWVLGMYIYSWIACIVWPVAACVLAKKRLNTLEDVWMFRDPKYITERPWIDIVELLEFGVPIPGIQQNRSSLSTMKSNQSSHEEETQELTGNGTQVAHRVVLGSTHSTEVSKTTLLHRACAGGPLCSEYLKLFIDLYPQWVTQRDSNGRTPMECIVTNSDPNAWNDCVEMARILLDTGNVIVGDKELWQACLNSSIEMVQLLLKNGCEFQLRPTSREELRNLETLRKERKEIFEYAKDRYLSDRGRCMQIFVRRFNGGRKTITLDVRVEDPVYFVRLLIAEKEGIPPDVFSLTYAGRSLEALGILSDYRIQKESTLQMHASMHRRM